MPPDVFQAIAEFSVDPTNSKRRQAELDDDVRRLTNLYRRKLIDDAEWDSEMARIEEQRRGLEPVKPERLKVVEALCADLQRLWKEATPEERRGLVAPLIDEVYVDLQVRKPVAVRPHEDFRVLVAAAFEAADSGIRVISKSEFLGEELQLVGLVETGES